MDDYNIKQTKELQPQRTHWNYLRNDRYVTMYCRTPSHIHSRHQSTAVLFPPSPKLAVRNNKAYNNLSLIHLPAFWFLFLLTFLQISLVTRSPPRLPFSFYLCLRLLTFSSGYPDGVSLLISNVPPLSLYLLITDPPLSPPNPQPNTVWGGGEWASAQTEMSGDQADP